MPWLKDRWPIIGFGGLLTAASGMALDHFVFGAAKGDPLAFVGALIGASGTVLTAVWVTRYQARSLSRERHRLLIEAFTEAIEQVEELQAIGWSRASGRSAKDAMRNFTRAMVWLSRIAKAAEPDSVAMMKALDALHRIPPSQYTDLIRSVTAAEMYASDRTDFGNIAAKIAKRLRAARAYLR